LSLEESVQQLEQHILDLISASKRHTFTKMVMGNIPSATLYNFTYMVQENPLAINSNTLKKVAVRLDELESCNHYYKDLQKEVSHFIKTYIMVDTIGELMKLDLNYVTLHKIKDVKLNTPYRMTTLVKYAQIVEEKRGELKHVKH